MPGTAFDYIAHPDGVHELIYNEITPETVDASIAIVDVLLSARLPHDPEPLRLLAINPKDGTPDMLLYAANANRALISKHGFTGLRNIYIALVYSPGMMMSFWVSFFTSFRLGIHIKTFPLHRREDAMAWLASLAEEQE
jgi:hypothetical protein